ncbi:MAG: glucuronate isomerase [Oscillospiraceae bacterium]|nr:glucuronate isomerase [Oscillospiraceae bacterium]
MAEDAAKGLKAGDGGPALAGAAKAATGGQGGWAGKSLIVDGEGLKAALDAAFAETRAIDMHTHLFAPCFGEMALYGIDELLTYHYLVAEATVRSRVGYGEFGAMGKGRQAEFVWEALFVGGSPVSEASSSLISIFKALGLEVGRKDLAYYRERFRELETRGYLDRILEVAGVERVVMTNDPFDDAERAVWEGGGAADPRFMAALRLDRLLNEPAAYLRRLAEWGYKVAPISGSSLDEGSCGEVTRFLTDWMGRMGAVYCAASLPPEFTVTDGSLRASLIRRCVMPACGRLGMPFAMMVGVRRQVNPLLGMAGDGVGRADLEGVARLCAEFPSNRFMLTALSLENQHESAVLARKFNNLLLFGCWWFVNNPSLIKSITSMRAEMLGFSFVAQHSDCRVTEQLISKWSHSRRIIYEVMRERYASLLGEGYGLDEGTLRREVRGMLGGNFLDFIKAPR